MDNVSIDAPNELVSDQHVSFNAFLRAMFVATTIASNRPSRYTVTTEGVMQGNLADTLN